MCSCYFYAANLICRKAAVDGYFISPRYNTKEIDYKIRRRTEAYKDFCKAAKVKENTERLRYECSKENLGKSKAWQQMEKQGKCQTKI